MSFIIVDSSEGFSLVRGKRVDYLDIVAFLYEQKRLRSPYIDVVWKTQDVTDGLYMAEADGCWDLIFITEDKNTKILLSGPTSRPTPTPYKAGNTNLGIKFKQGVFLSGVSTRELCDKVQILPKPTASTFELLGYSWKIPNYDNIEEFTDALEHRGLLGRDEVVTAILSGSFSRTTTERSVQRHFEKSTGVSPGYIRRIEQARRAIESLRQGIPLVDTAIAAGYADQAHMTRSLRQLVGLTPAQIAAADGPIFPEKP